MLGRSPARNSRLRAVAICVALGLVIGIWHNRTAARGSPDRVTGAVRTVAMPAVSAASGTGRWVDSQFGWLFRGRGLDAENRALRAENDRLKQEAATLREAAISEQRLRRQLGFQETLPPTRISADVVAFHPSPNYDSMIVSRGSRDGVAPGVVVVSPAGVVGQVIDAASSNSVVLLLTDSASSIGAMVQRAESRVVGVCKGNGTDQLSLSYLPRDADVKVGDTIVSSGLGGDKGIYPKGIPIGAVTSVGLDASGSSRRVSVRPFARFNRLEEVYLLK